MNRDALERDYPAATQQHGKRWLSDWATVRVAGIDRAPFLHNMCTNDIKSLNPGSGCEAFFTDVKGRIVAHAFVLVGETSTLLVMVPGLADKLIAHLDRYIIREDVQLEDASGDVEWAFILALPRTPRDSLAWSHFTHDVDGTPVQMVRCELPWCGGYLCGADRNGTEQLRLRVAKDGVTVADDVWHAIRIESAWPLWGVDFDDSNLPQEVNRDAMAIHFRKGCYLGQETVARIDALGHVNKKLVQVRFAGDEVPIVGSELSQGERNVGRVTSSTWSPRFNAPLALAMVRRGANETGTMLQWNGVPAEVIELPKDPTAA